MLRGHRSIFLSLFDEPDVLELPSPPERKGRNEVLVQARNEALIHRHYYYAKLKGRQYQDVLTELEREFFISQRTIIDVIMRHGPALRRLHDTKPTIRQMRDRYPFLTWN